MPRVVCISDIHESLPEIPECDLLVIAGDITYGFKGDHASQQAFLVNEFREWAQRVPADEVVVIAGNHDQSVEAWGWPESVGSDRKLHYLQDSGLNVCGLNIWGTPWQPYFYNWAFNAPERGGEDFLKQKFDLIPPDTDILLCHGPPRGYGDRVGNPNVPDRSNQERVGSQSLVNALRRVKPRLMVCGHIHCDYGKWTLRDTDGSKLPTTIVNAALVNERYVLTKPPVVIDL